MTKKDIKQVFKSANVQLSADALGLVQEHLKKETIKMADRCKIGNFKRLTVEHFWVATGDWGVAPSKRKLK